MKKDNNIEEILKNIGAEELPADIQQIAEQTSRDFEKNLTQSNQPKYFVLGDYIMKSRITKLAAAAVIFVAVLVAFDPFNVTKTGGVAWGKVAQHVQQIETFIFGLTIKVSDPNTDQTAGQTTAKWIIYLSEKYGFRMDVWADQDVVSWYVAPNADKIIMVVPDKKERIELPLPADKWSQKPEEYKDPKEYISRFMSRPYKELGRSVINGVQVEGIEVTDPPTDGEQLDNAVGRLWVDTETELPVRIEIEGMAGKKMVQWIMDFKWAEAVAPTLFDPNIPNNFPNLTTD
ncbi:MAG: hypothetical protein WAV28_04330 [Sedimentisphaerales bacterium]